MSPAHYSLAFSRRRLRSPAPSTPAQDKKEPPKKKERIAIADPKEAAKDADFAVQGEYEGEIKLGEEAMKAGIHVIAKG